MYDMAAMIHGQLRRKVPYFVRKQNGCLASPSRAEALAEIIPSELALDNSSERIMLPRICFSPNRGTLTQEQTTVTKKFKPHPHHLHL